MEKFPKKVVKDAWEWTGLTRREAVIAGMIYTSPFGDWLLNKYHEKRAAEARDREITQRISERLLQKNAGHKKDEHGPTEADKKKLKEAIEMFEKERRERGR